MGGSWRSERRKEETLKEAEKRVGGEEGVRTGAGWRTGVNVRRRRGK